MCDAEGVGSVDSASRKSASDGKTELSIGVSDAGNGVGVGAGVISPPQLAKITANVLTPKTAGRILMNASDVQQTNTISRQTLLPAFLTAQIKGKPFVKRCPYISTQAKGGGNLCILYHFRRSTRYI